MKIISSSRHPANLILAVTVILLAAAVIDAAYAQGVPFGGPRPPSAPPAAPVGGIVGWLLAKQAEFYRQFSGLIRAAKAEGTAAWSLMGLSFLYGVFHAAGPGHGKAVISSYLVANRETWTRGVVLSFVSALLQAMVAVLIVGVAAALLNASAATMNSAVNAIETVSYALIVLIGARLLWVKGRSFMLAMRAMQRPRGAVGAAVTPRGELQQHDHGDCPDHDHGGQDHAHHDHVEHSPVEHDRHSHDSAEDHQGHRHAHHDHDHDCSSAWGHAHAPEPEELAGAGGWKRGLSAIVAIGLRPCSGAILVLVFALAQGLFWVGIAATFMMGLGTFITVAATATIAVGAGAWARRIAATRSGYRTLAMRGLEVGAAVLITVFGLLLLGGYMVNERMIAFSHGTLGR